MNLILLEGGSFIEDILNKIIVSNSLGLMFSIVANVILARAYKSEKDYNRERDLSVTRIITLMQARLEDLQNLNNSFSSMHNTQEKQLMLTEQMKSELEKLSASIK